MVDFLKNNIKGKIMKKTFIKENSHPENGSTTQPVIKFNMKEEQDFRASRRKYTQEILKLRNASYPIKNNYELPEHLSRQYKLAPVSNYMVLEFNKLDETQRESIKDFILTKTKMIFVNSFETKYENDGLTFTLFIVDISRVK